MNSSVGLEEKKKEVITKTVELVYEFLKENNNADDIDTLNFVRKEYDYSNIEVGESLEFFAVQEGAVYIAFKYIKENPKATKEEVVREVMENYSDLLDKYYEEDNYE